MVRLVQRKLIIPRGDTGSFSVPALPSLVENNVAVFTIIDKATQTKLLEKQVAVSGDLFTIRFEHEDTVKLPIGKYYWDIKIYQNPVYDTNEQLVGGDEIDSYYAAYSLPECEVRITGDQLAEKQTTIQIKNQSDMTLIRKAVQQAQAAKQAALDAISAIDAKIERINEIIQGSGYTLSNEDKAQIVSQVQSVTNNSIEAQDNKVNLITHSVEVRKPTYSATNVVNNITLIMNGQRIKWHGSGVNEQTALTIDKFLWTEGHTYRLIVKTISGSGTIRFNFSLPPISGTTRIPVGTLKTLTSGQQVCEFTYNAANYANGNYPKITFYYTKNYTNLITDYAVLDITDEPVIENNPSQQVVTELPEGGTTGQVLAKASNADGDVTWITIQQGDSSSTPAPITPSIDMGIIGDVQNSLIASHEYYENEFFVANNKVYRVTNYIGEGDTIIPNTNCRETTILTQISNIYQWLWGE